MGGARARDLRVALVPLALVPLALALALAHAASLPDLPPDPPPLPPRPTPRFRAAYGPGPKRSQPAVREATSTAPGAALDLEVRPATSPPKDRPFFEDVSPRAVSVAVGGNAILRCRVKNIGNRSVAWIRKRDTHILTWHVVTYTGDARFSVLHPEPSDDWDLRVSYVQPRDHGVYECQVNTDPKMHLAVNLTVIDDSQSADHPASPGANPGVATTILGPREVYVKKGSTIALTCVLSVVASPPVSLLWLHAGGVVDFDSPRGGISLETEKSENGTVSKLLVTRASFADNGNYTCRGQENRAGATRIRPSSVNVFVLSGEQPAAMQTPSRATHASLLLAHITIFHFSTSMLFASA